MKKQRFVSALLTVTLISTLFTVFAVPTSAATYGDFKYETRQDGTINIVSYSGSAKSVEVPETIDGYTVTSIGFYAFKMCSSIEGIVLPDTITEIGTQAFYGTAYYNNKNNWENGLLYIGDCLIEADSSKTIGVVEIKPGTRLIASGALSNCDKVTQVIIPDSVVVIDDYAFSKCSSLGSIEIPDSVTICDAFGLFSDCKSLKKVVLGNGITKLLSSTFKNCENLTDVTLGENLTYIGDHAFYNTAIKEITLPDSVTEIEYRAFMDCSSLKKVTIGPNIEYIGDSAFFCDNLEKVVYKGTEAMWNQISISSTGNGALGRQVEFLNVAPTISDIPEPDTNEPSQESSSGNAGVILVLILILLVVAFSGFLIYKNRTLTAGNRASEEK